jgi:hypothetical protein
VFKYEGEAKKIEGDPKGTEAPKAHCAECKKETELTCHVYGLGHVCEECRPKPFDDLDYTEADRKMDQTLLNV